MGLIAFTSVFIYISSIYHIPFELIEFLILPYRLPGFLYHSSRILSFHFGLEGLFFTFDYPWTSKAVIQYLILIPLYPLSFFIVRFPGFLCHYLSCRRDGITRLLETYTSPGCCWIDIDKCLNKTDGQTWKPTIARTMHAPWGVGLSRQSFNVPGPLSENSLRQMEPHYATL